MPACPPWNRGTFCSEAGTPAGIPSVVPGEVAARTWGVEALVGSERPCGLEVGAGQRSPELLGL